MTPIEQIHDALIDRGFRAEHGPAIRYVGERRYNGHIFPVEISGIDERFINLPKIKLTRLPEGLPSMLPHIHPDGTLCYLDKEGVVLDRYRPQWSLNIIIDCLDALLESYTKAEVLPAEFADEFMAYWDPARLCYLLTKQRPSVAMSFKRKTLEGDEETEVVIGENDGQLNDWKVKRDGISENNQSVPAVIVNMKKPPLVPLGSEWPPKALREFHGWLSLLDQGAAQSMVAQLSEVANRNTDVPIVIVSPDSIFGVLVKYGPMFRLENRNYQQKGNRKGSGTRVRSLVLSNNGIREFKRLYVHDATMSHITSRPLGKSSLENLKIAQIGCGAIGGYSAVMLTQAGAGLGSGKLHLYDSDIFSSDNMGRHVLGVGHLGEQKSVALKHYIDIHSSTTSLNVEAFGNWDCNTHLFNDYDLIIDVTGNQMVSTDLAHELHRMKRRPAIIHGWIDAGGMAVRALLDDGKKACYRCLSKETEFGLEEGKFKLWDGERPKEIPTIKRRCGASYQPYASNAPTAAAGLVQNLALDFSDGSVETRFRHLSLSKIIRMTKFANPDRVENCPCCQKT